MAENNEGNMMRELELMGTLGCHLCDKAAEVIVPHVNTQLFAVYEVDIAEDDQLLARYGESIPVLVDVESGKELNWPFNAQTLIEFLNQFS